MRSINVSFSNSFFQLEYLVDGQLVRTGYVASVATMYLWVRNWLMFELVDGREKLELSK